MASRMATRPALTNPALAFGDGFSGSTPPAGLTGGSSVLAANSLMAPPAGYTRPASTSSQTAPPAWSSTSTPSPLQAPGQNMSQPGYTEQGLNLTQNRLLEDPFGDVQAGLVGQAQQPSQGQNHLNDNLGALDGDGNTSQYWEGQQGQFNDPFAGEQFTRNSTQNFSPTGPAGAFNTQAQGQYGEFTGYQGPGASAGQYGANASSGPLAGQSFYDQYGGGLSTTGTYSDPNLSAGQYAQTQGAFGDMPLPDSADPYYDRAIQLGTQSYNQGAAGRGVYGSSEALSGVGNVITDLNAQRAKTAFDNQMAINTEQRMRQQLLGEQARMGDLSSLSAFDSGLKGVETYGNLAKTAGQQTLDQQTMLGNQANDVDDNSQAAQNSNIAGLSALGDIANSADARAIDRYRESNTAMNNADKTQIDRVKTGADIADMADDNERGDFDSATTAANLANDNRDQSLTTASNIAHTGSADELARLTEFGNQGATAEDDRQARVQSEINATFRHDENMAKAVGDAAEKLFGASQADFENYVKTSLSPMMQAAGLSQQEQDKFIASLQAGLQIGLNG